MSSLVKLFPHYKALGIKPEDRQFTTSTADNLGVLIPGLFTLIKSDKEDKEITDSVKMNQVVKVVPSIPLSTTKYTILVSYNPKLAELGAVSCPAILPPGEEVSLVIRAYRNFNLDEFTDMYSFILYALD